MENPKCVYDGAAVGVSSSCEDCSIPWMNEAEQDMNTVSRAEYGNVNSRPTGTFCDEHDCKLQTTQVPEQKGIWYALSLKILE